MWIRKTPKKKGTEKQEGAFVNTQTKLYAVLMVFFHGSFLLQGNRNPRVVGDRLGTHVQQQLGGPELQATSFDGNDSQHVYGGIIVDCSI